MKILMLRSYFKPEVTSGASINDGLYEAFTGAGHTCKMYVPTPSRGVSEEVRAEYKKRPVELLYNGKMEVHRFPLYKEPNNFFLRLIRYRIGTKKHLKYALQNKDADVLYLSSTPFFNLSLMDKIKKKTGMKIVYDLQDIFPDYLLSSGLVKKNSFLWKRLRKMEDRGYAAADKITVIAESARQNLMEKGVPTEKIELIYNWVDADAVKPVQKSDNPLFGEFQIPKDKFTAVYAGNLGTAQGASVILDAAEKLKEHKQIQFVIFGGGLEFDTVKKQIADRHLENILLFPLLPQNRVGEVYSLGDVSLVVCKKGVGKSSMPSKTWSIMACNTPIIASFDTDSELAEVLKTSGSGVTVEPENPKALAEAILDASEHPLHGEGGRRFVETHADKKICLQRYLSVVESVKKERR